VVDSIAGALEVDECVDEPQHSILSLCQAAAWTFLRGIVRVISVPFIGDDRISIVPLSMRARSFMLKIPIPLDA
jgi:hypothetical protein